MKRIRYGFALIEILIVLGIISSLSILSLLGATSAMTKVKNGAKKRDISAIAQAYEANYEEISASYLPLTAEDFKTHTVPAPDDGTLYSGLLTSAQSAFQVCAVLNGSNPTTCNVEGPNCYCIVSSRGLYVTPDPGSSSPTPTPEGGPTATPTPGVCTISSASWSVSSATEGDPVSLNVAGSSGCAGQSVSFDVFEEDTLLEGGIDDPALVDPIETTFGVDNTALGTWFAEFQNDCSGLCLPNEYYFNALVSGTGTTRSALPLLNVSASGGGATPTPEPTSEPTATSVPPTETPVPTPTPDVKRVFATSGKTNGGLGGLTGADAYCQSAADSASLGGTWKAWISSSSVGASSRLSHHTGPYRLVNGITIANNWDDLVDGSLLSSINVSETGGSVSGNAWTTTNISGGAIGSAHCASWTNGTSSGNGRYGSVSSISSTWTNSTSNNGCHLTNSLYCFEQ